MQPFVATSNVRGNKRNSLFPSEKSGGNVAGEEKCALAGCITTHHNQQ